MNKIVLSFGLLVFFISIVVFSQQGMSATDVLFKSFVVFFLVTLMSSILVIAFIKAINKASEEKLKKLSENLIGNQDHE